MKKITSLLLLAMFLPLISSAETPNMDAATPADGFNSAPVLRCPAVPEAYAKMLTNLKSLKSAIKKDASCEPINQEVASLEQLLGERRQEVKDLVEKNKKQALNEEELLKIKTYVEDVTNKVFATTELLNRNNYCFSEDRKSFDFSDLASLTLDATALAKSVAGPWSAPVAIGGQVIAGIFQGLNNVVKNRRGFDFSNLEQREKYVQSLCTYYNYRQEVDALLYPERKISELQDLENSLNGNLNSILSNCTACGKIAKLQEVMKRMSSIEGPSLLELNTLSDQANSEFKRPLGTYTIRALTSLEWVKTELERIKTDSDESGSVGRDMLAEVRADIDQFLFDKEAPQFLYYQNRKAYDLFRQFNSYVKSEGQDLMYASLKYTKDFPQDFYYYDEAKTLDFLYGLQGKLQAQGQSNLVHRIKDYYQKSLDLYDATIVATNVSGAYCNFFRNAGLYSGDIASACEGGMFASLEKNINRVQIQTRKYNLGLIDYSDKVYSSDWVESLRKVMEQISSDQDLFTRR